MRTKQELTEDIRRDRRAALVVNARSRRGRQLYADAHARLVAAGFELLGAYAVDRPGELENSLTAALAHQPDLLVAGGGDGTISTAGRMLAHRDVALGLLPLGTTNNFARTVGILPDLDEAVATLVDGKVIDVDLGIAGDMPFTNHVGAGPSQRSRGTDWVRTKVSVPSSLSRANSGTPRTSPISSGVNAATRAMTCARSFAAPAGRQLTAVSQRPVRSGA
ncbi:diacylglycerol/lipid kinase family protein, partial [Actinoplanes philippinensis]|uniref:diacylglycerol/lipid kinase family protein n=1 Tax=Actinoplanes philippinensis TaxID=35752 RepID=UPI0033E012CD